MENLDIFTNLMKIDLGAIGNNYKAIDKYIRGNNATSEVALVLKSNAYGIGLEEVAPIVYIAGARKFFVMWLGEALRLKKLLPDVVVYTLSGVLPNTEEIFFKNNIVPVISNEIQLKRWLEYAKKIDKKLPCNIKFDTGMNRMGINDTRTDIISELSVERYLDVHYIMSHMYMNNASNPAQLERLNRLRESFPQFKTSFSDTYSAFLGGDWYSDLFRVGRALYGVFDRKLNGVDYPKLTKCAFSVEARVIQIRKVPKDESVSYGATYKFDRDSIIATLGIGYSHGLPTVLGNKGYVIVNGHPARIVGNVTMEYTMIDVTDCGDIQPESWVSVMNSEDTVDDISLAANMTSLEIMASFSKGVQKKIYYTTASCRGV